MPPTAAEIRKQFIDYFAEKHGHAAVPSSPVIPFDDPTLLFTNAGMNQFKDVFLGAGTRDYKRAVDTQKCIRAGGKHNDLEDVGRDTYHHTFFEMLGNWSFGDYFKAEAIRWAWDLLTNVWGLEKDRLYATVFAGDAADGLDADTEAEDLWKNETDIAHDHISRWDRKDNFWEMGDTGPCGPCSEIHYDGRTDEERAKVPGAGLVNTGHTDVIEIWNLVFIQFNRAPSSGDRPGRLTPLPEKHVDTGMGFERIVRVLQNKNSNYSTDLWTPLFKAIEQHTGAKPYGDTFDGHTDIAYRVLADHIRCLTVAISDGGRPSNEGRGYVLRRILRRAVRHVHQTLGVEGPVLYQLVPAVVDTLGEAFPDLRKNPDHVAEVIKDEEESFLKTLDRGIEHFELGAVFEALRSGYARDHDVTIAELPRQLHEMAADQVQRFFRGELNAPTNTRFTFAHKDAGELQLVFVPHEYDEWAKKNLRAPAEISAIDAFKLHDTYGFPIDLTRVMAEERGMTVDEAGFDQLMLEAREKSRAGSESKEKSFVLTPDAIETLRKLNVPPTPDDDKYFGRPIGSDIKAIWNGDDFDNTATVGRTVAIILDRTNFYAEAGGQVGDRGEISTQILPGVVEMRGYTGTQTRGGATFRVEDTQRFGDFILHIGRGVDGTLRVGDNVSMKVHRQKRAGTQSNHTSTHLLNFALREVLGDDVQQKGSLVAHDRLRFDFSHARAMTPEELERVETMVNELIEKNERVHARNVPLEAAMKITGVRAVFGEKYPDPVRVVSIGRPVEDLERDPTHPGWRQYSVEFCGGTHVNQTGDARRFIIRQEQALASGVRRIVAETGHAALASSAAGNALVQRAELAMNMRNVELMEEFEEISGQLESMPMSVVTRQKVELALEPLREKVKELRKESEAAIREHVVSQARMLAEEDDRRVLVHHVMGADKDALMSAMDVVKAKRSESAIMLFAPNEQEGSVAIVATVPSGMIERGLKAGDWVREAAQVCGGGGGGRPDMAQAGGKDVSKVADAIYTAREFAESKLN